MSECALVRFSRGKTAPHLQTGSAVLPPHRWSDDRLSRQKVRASFEREIARFKIRSEYVKMHEIFTKMQILVFQLGTLSPEIARVLPISARASHVAVSQPRDLRSLTQKIESDLQ